MCKNDRFEKNLNKKIMNSEKHGFLLALSRGEWLKNFKGSSLARAAVFWQN